MIGATALAALVALVGMFLLDNLVVVESNWPFTVIVEILPNLGVNCRENKNWK